MTLITVLIVHVLAVIAPGPDFFLIVRNSLATGWRSGVLTSFGIASAGLVEMLLGLFLVSLISEFDPRLLIVLKWVGALYLGYIGWKCLRSVPAETDLAPAGSKIEEAHPDSQVWGFFRMGFLSCLLNPKAIIYFFSLSTQLVRSSTPFVEELALAVFLNAIGFCVYSLIALFIGSDSVRTRLSSWQTRIERTMGVIFIGFAGALIFVPI